jgi:hypothetical protein
LPSFVLRYKRYDADAVEKFMTTLFITEDSYRMASVGQALGLPSHLLLMYSLQAHNSETMSFYKQ